MGKLKPRERQGPAAVLREIAASKSYAWSRKPSLSRGHTQGPISLVGKQPSLCGKKGGASPTACFSDWLETKPDLSPGQSEGAPFLPRDYLKAQQGMSHPWMRVSHSRVRLGMRLGKFQGFL